MFPSILKNMTKDKMNSRLKTQGVRSGRVVSAEVAVPRGVGCATLLTFGCFPQPGSFQSRSHPEVPWVASLEQKHSYHPGNSKEVGSSNITTKDAPSILSTWEIKRILGSSVPGVRQKPKHIFFCYFTTSIPTKLLSPSSQISSKLLKLNAQWPAFTWLSAVFETVLCSIPHMNILFT